MILKTVLLQHFNSIKVQLKLIQELGKIEQEKDFNSIKVQLKLEMNGHLFAHAN